MSIVTTSLRNLSGFLQDHQASFSNGLLVLFTIAGEQIFRFNAFQCPCSQPEAETYAMVFMAVPAIVLFILGIVVSNLSWRVCHGCCHRSEGNEHGSKKACARLTEVTARALTVPFAWLFVTLLDGTYYACMESSKPCDITSPEYLENVAYSQIISWFSLLSVIALVFIVITVIRCCDSVTYTQYRFINSYREAEQDQFDLVTKEHTKVLAQKNVETFILNPALVKKDWDAISVTPDFKLSDANSSPLTPLQEWIKKPLVETGTPKQQTMSV